MIGDVLLNAGSITANSILIDRISGGPTQGINISMQAENNITVATSFQITANNSFSNIGDGVNISDRCGEPGYPKLESHGSQ